MSQIIVAVLAFALSGGNFFLFLFYSAIGGIIMWGMGAPKRYKEKHPYGEEEL